MPEKLGERVTVVETYQGLHEDRHTRLEGRLEERFDSLEGLIRYNGTSGNRNGRRRRRDYVGLLIEKGGIAGGGGGILYLLLRLLERSS